MDALKKCTSKWDRCCNCCAGVPYPSLGAWLLLAVSVFASCGSIIAAEHKTNSLLQGDNIIPYQKEAAIGVMCGMILFGCLHLLVATLSSERLRHSCFNTRRKNICGRVLNITVGVLTAILHILWQLLSTAIAIPLFLFCLLYYTHKVKSQPCIDLKSYAMSQESKKICGENLTKFYGDSLETMQCYAIAYVASIFVVFSLKLIGICTGANYAYIKESRFANFYAYQDKAGKDSGNGTEICSPLMYKNTSKA